MSGRDRGGILSAVPDLPLFSQHIREKNLAGARIAALLGATLVPSGIVLDWLTSREHLSTFLIIRLSASLVCLVFLALTYAPRARDHVFALGLGPIVASAFAVELMVRTLGGYASPYYAGLVQVMLVVGLIFYWRIGQAVLVCVLIVLMWALPALAQFPDIDVGPFTNNLYALLVTAAIAVTSNATRFRLAKREFAASSALARTSEELVEALDRAREVDRTKSEFFANISHELRTPLTLIVTPVDELIGRLKPGYERSALDVVKRNAARLLRMIDDLLDLAKLESGGLRLKVSDLDVGALAQQVAENAVPAARATGIQLDFGSDGDAPEMFGDPHRVEIIITNLIGNAMKFTPPGGRIDVRVIYNEAGASVEVADTGPGISKEQQDLIFERFHQTDSSERRQAGGVGIGLSLARELAQLHGGSVTVESKLGEGSTFTLFLKSGRDHFHAEIIERRRVQVDVHPDRRAGDRLAAHDPRKTDEATLSTYPSYRPPERLLLDRGRVPRLLVAEDEDDLREFIVSVLQATYVVDAAKNGAEAVELLQKNRPDLVLTDVMMPGTSGLDLCKAIKEDPSLRHIPVILLTARGENEAALDGYEAGADEFVSKPFHTAILQARIRAHLKMRGLSLQLADQARLASAGTLAAGLAHEVKNPLNAAMNAVKVLEKGGSSRVSNEKLMGVVLDALARIDGIISALSAHARPADGDDLAPCNVRKAIESTLNLLDHKLRNRVTVHQDYQSSGDVFASARAFNQVLLNLIDNSIRSDAKNIWIELQQTDQTISVAVADDGPGIPPDVVHRIFDPFFTTRVEGEGTGLGLHLSRRIAQDCGGELRYEPRPGGGARFVMEIPAMGLAA